MFIIILQTDFDTTIELIDYLRTRNTYTVYC